MESMPCAAAVCRGCSAIDVLQWIKDDGSGRAGQVRAEHLRTNDLRDWFPLMAKKSNVCIIIARANEVRTCTRCRHAFIEALSMPEIWWSDYCRRSNGYFGCEVTRSAGSVTGYNTWAYFETKHMDDNLSYKWNKTNLFVRWLPKTKHTVITVFDESLRAEERLANMFLRPDPDCLVDPFWVYTQVITELTRLEDSAVWAVRDEVRAREKEPEPKTRPRPDYRRLHDVARHGIHVSETLDVAARSIAGIILEHDAFMASDLAADKAVSQDIHRRLRFLETMIVNLRHRSSSNEKRLQNEIQLAFNVVAQHDAGISAEMGRAMKTDSAAMRTIAFVTLVFLPPTFVSAVFSMSFFDFNADSGWTVSGKFWIYWACAVPLTLVFILSWHCWRDRELSCSREQESLSIA